MLGKGYFIKMKIKVRYIVNMLWFMTVRIPVNNNMIKRCYFAGFMMKWNNRIKAGTVYKNPVMSLDIFATLVSAIGMELPTDRKYDGVDLMPYINGDKKEAPHDALYWRSDFNKAIRKGDWKLIVNEFDNSNLLYNIKDDKEERFNLYTLKPKVAESLNHDLNEWEKELIKPLWPRVVNYVYKDETGKYVFAF